MSKSTYIKKAGQSPRMQYRRNPNVLKSREEEEFRAAYGDYPTPNELKQFLPYLKFKHKSRKYDLMFNL